MTKETRERLAYLRKEIEKESISYGEIAELQAISHDDLIEYGDIVLMEWAGIEENKI